MANKKGDKRDPLMSIMAIYGSGGGNYQFKFQEEFW
jgi:hypothetical protein